MAAMPSVEDIHRLDFGYFVRPAGETESGQPRFEPCLGYLVRLPDGCLLFDTGMADAPPQVDAHYHPVRRPLREALGTADAAIEDIKWVINCHLHFDHCGANPSLTGRPIFTQAAELAMARSNEHYTLPHLIDFGGARYEELQGEAELWPGIHIVPTPGHTDGHQSLVIRCQDGTAVLLGQAHNNGADFTSDYLARRARNGKAPEIASRAWLDRLLAFDPKRIFFAHDLAVWEP
jgi:N-acyl homoserine lactone hydrolase